MKKIIITAVALLAVIGIVAGACGGSSPETAPAPAETTRPPATDTALTEDEEVWIDAYILSAEGSCDDLESSAFLIYRDRPAAYQATADRLAQEDCEAWAFLTDEEVERIADWVDRKIYSPREGGVTCYNSAAIASELGDEGRDWIIQTYAARLLKATVGNISLMECDYEPEDKRHLTDIFQGRSPWES